MHGARSIHAWQDKLHAKHNSGRTCKFINGKIQQSQHAKQDIRQSQSHNRLYHEIDYKIWYKYNRL